MAKRLDTGWKGVSYDELVSWARLGRKMSIEVEKVLSKFSKHSDNLEAPNSKPRKKKRKRRTKQEMEAVRAQETADALAAATPAAPAPATTAATTAAARTTAPRTTKKRRRRSGNSARPTAVSVAPEE